MDAEVDGGRGQAVDDRPPVASSPVSPAPSDSPVTLSGVLADVEVVEKQCSGPSVLELNCCSQTSSGNVTSTHKYTSRQEDRDVDGDDGVKQSEKIFKECTTESNRKLENDGEVHENTKEASKEERNSTRRCSVTGSLKQTAKEIVKHDKEVTSVNKTETINDNLQITRTTQRIMSRTCKRINIEDLDSSDEDGADSGINVGTTPSVTRTECTTSSQKHETRLVGGDDDTADSLLAKYGDLISVKKGTASDAKQITAAPADPGSNGSIQANGNISSESSVSEKQLVKEQSTVKRDEIATSASSSTSSGVSTSSSTDFPELTPLPSSAVSGSDPEKLGHGIKAGDTGSAAGYPGLEPRSVIEQESRTSKLASGKTVRTFRMGEMNGHVDEVENATKERDKEPGVPSFVPDNRKSADDLVKRILAESVSGSYSGKARVDMGGAAAGDNVDRYNNRASYGTSGSRDRGYPSDTASGYGASRRFDDVNGIDVHPRKRYDDYGDIERKNDSKFSYEEETYEETRRNKGGTGMELVLFEDSKPFGKSDLLDKHDLDDLDSEINEFRQKFRNDAARRAHGRLEFLSDEPEDVQGGRFGRGRMMRQHYIDDDDDDDAFHPEPEPEPLPDEDFEPQRREETEDMVKERTAGIRRVVENQTSVLDKLRRASESFDELNAEIKEMRQQFIERQASRSYGDTDGLFDDLSPQATPPRGRRTLRNDYSSYNRFISDRRAATLDRELESDNLITGKSLNTLSGYRSLAPNNVDDDDEGGFSYKPRFSSRPRVGRSHSLYTESSDYTSYRGRNRAIENGADSDGLLAIEAGPPADDEDPQAGNAYAGNRYSAYTSPYTGGYGAGVGGYTPRYGASRPQFSRAQTLNDFNFDHSPTNSVYGGSGGAGGGSSGGFTSRFLNKVRNDAGDGGPKTSKPPRDKPFKSRFLRKSFDADIGSTKTNGSTSSSSFSSRFTKSASTTSAPTVSSSAPSDASETKQETATTAAEGGESKD